MEFLRFKMHFTFFHLNDYLIEQSFPVPHELQVCWVAEKRMNFIKLLKS